MSYSLGAKPDRPDPRDFKLPAKVPPPGLAGERKFYTMVSPDFRINQGGEGTCVAHAATNLLLAGPSPHKTYPDFQTEEKAHQFARKLYLEASGDITYQQGMYPRDACAELLERGLISSYWKVEQVEDITSALLSFGPVMITVPWYSSMYNVAGGYIKVNLSSTHVGYHEIAVTGVDMAPDNGVVPFVRIQNSWGNGWGTNGTAKLTVENLRLLNIWDNWTFKEVRF